MSPESVVERGTMAKMWCGWQMSERSTAYDFTVPSISQKSQPPLFTLNSGGVKIYDMNPSQLLSAGA